MKLKADFVSDWLSGLKDILENHWGYNINGVDDKELPYIYFNAESRRPDLKPRKVFLADTFQCPKGFQVGWKRLKDLVETGQDITPNLSKRVSKIHNKDSMLNDWGVHHFHLGERIENGFIERTGPLLFALIEDKRFYAIGVYEHGDWANSEIVEIIHRNWPDAISIFKINGAISVTEITEQQRLTLRENNGNAFIAVSDGTIYAPIGGGVVGAGYNIQAITKTDKQKARLERLQKDLQAQLVNVRDKLIECGYSGEPEIEARLVITEDEYIAVLPKFNIRIIILSKK